LLKLGGAGMDVAAVAFCGVPQVSKGTLK
jgi:hypothetical protein